MQKNLVLGSARMFFVLTVITGVIYPLAVTFVAHRAFPFQARGSILYMASIPVGSALIAQAFDDSTHFMSRPSAGNYSTLPSAASNLAATNHVLRDSVKARSAIWGKSVGEIPADLLFSSASGVDPHISPRAALFQLDRIARARGLSVDQRQALEKKIGLSTEKPRFRVAFGQ
jgi:K+-transporting ATPase ATPase C chain